MVDSFADVPVIELTSNEWDEFSLTGYGYLIKEQDIANTKSQLSNHSEEMLSKYRSMYPEVNRDLYIFDLYKKLGTTPFFLILEGNEAAIIHEVAHIVWNRLSPEEQAKVDLPEVLAPDNDQYLTSDSERFTHMTEMEYFKSQGMDFDDYFRLHNAREYQLINDPTADPQYKELAQMDYNDYQTIWHHAKTSSFHKNWFVKIAQALTVTTGTHDKSGRPIYILQGPTYPIKGKLGRSGLGFNYWRPVGWWIYQDRMTNHVSAGLQQLGFDLSVLGGTPPQASGVAPVAPGIPDPQMPSEPPVEPATAAPVAPTGVTDQSWENTEPKSRWYGFPIKKPIYETMVPVEIEGQQFEVKVSLGRWFKKGRRRVPSYVYEVFWNDQIVGRLGKASPSDWGAYDEGEIAGAVPEFIRGRFAQGPKSKMYNAFKHYLQLSGRDPELTEYLKQFSDLDRQKIEKSIHLEEPGYEGDYPVKFFAYSDGINWYGETALEHPQAPRPATIFYIGDIPPDIHTIEQFNKWLDERINDPKVMERAKEGYLDYLKSFHFSDAEQEEARGQFAEVLPIIEDKITDVNFFRQKLMEHGYIRPSRRRRSNVPGMQPQDQIELLLDSRKIVDDSYNFGKLSTSPNYLYSVVAYLMHRHKAGNIGFGAAFGQIGSSIRDFHNTLKRYGANIDAGELYDYIDDLATKLLREVIGIQPVGSSWDQYQKFYGGGESVVSNPALSLDPFVQFAILHGLDEATIRANPVKAYRTLAHQFHPDRHQGDPEATDLFKQLGALWDAVSPEVKKSAESWLYRVCVG